MSSKTEKIRIGVFVAVTAMLIGVVLAVWGGMRFWGRRMHYTIVFDGTVYGLEPGAQVYLEGIKVGQVEKLAIVPEDLTKVRVTINVRSSTQVRANTRAVLEYAGITGLKVIDLRDGSLAAVRLPEGAQILTGETLLDKLERRAEGLIDQTSEIMASAKRVTDNLVVMTNPARMKTIDQLLDRTRTLADTLISTSQQLDAMIAENRAVLKDTLGALRGAVTSTREMIDNEVGGLVSNARALLADLGSLVRGSQGPLRSAVFDLRQASRNFKELTREVRDKPSRLLFSKPASERKLP